GATRGAAQRPTRRPSRAGALGVARLGPLERVAGGQAEDRAGFLGFELVLVEIPGQLILDAVELVEDFILGAVQPVGADETQGEGLPALLDENLQVGIVHGGDFLPENPAVGVALLPVCDTHGHPQGRNILDQAQVVHPPGLVVEAAIAEQILDVAIEVGVVGEDAGVGEADDGKGRGQVELDPAHPAVADIIGPVDEVPRALGALLPGVGQLDQVLHIPIEEVDAGDTLVTEHALVADIQAPGGFRLEIGIALQIVVGHFPFQQGGHDQVEVRAAHGAGDGGDDPVAVGEAVAQVGGGQQKIIVGAGAAGALLGAVVVDLHIGGLVTQTRFPLQGTGIAAQHGEQIGALLLDGVETADGGLEVGEQVGDPQGGLGTELIPALGQGEVALVRRHPNGGVALLGEQQGAEFQFGVGAQIERLRQLDAVFLVLDVLADATFLDHRDLVAEVDFRFPVVQAVVEIGGGQFDLGLAAEQGPGIATAQAVAGLLDVLVLLVVGFQVAAGVLRAGNGTGIVVFKGALILGAIGLDHHPGDVQFAAVIETDAVVAVEGGIGA